MNTFELIYLTVSNIPCGKVATYGDVAKQIGMPRGSRVVGYALHVNPSPIVIPCHRVVNRYGELSGSFAFGGADAQSELLKREGVEVINNKVDLNKYKFDFN